MSDAEIGPLPSLDEVKALQQYIRVMQSLAFCDYGGSDADLDADLKSHLAILARLAAAAGYELRDDV